jgi:hypothetical protein
MGGFFLLEIRGQLADRDRAYSLLLCKFPSCQWGVCVNLFENLALRAHNKRTRLFAGKISLPSNHLISLRNLLSFQSILRCNRIRFNYSETACPIWPRPKSLASQSFSSWFTWPMFSHRTPNKTLLARMLFTGCLDVFAGSNLYDGILLLPIGGTRTSQISRNHHQMIRRTNDFNIFSKMTCLSLFVMYIIYVW